MVEKAEQRAQVRRAEMLARLSPHTSARKGDEIELVVDTTSLHFFDPTDGAGIYGRPS
jgi:hypothetical protein